MEHDLLDVGPLEHHGDMQSAAARRARQHLGLHLLHGVARLHAGLARVLHLGLLYAHHLHVVLAHRALLLVREHPTCAVWCGAWVLVCAATKLAPDGMAYNRGISTCAVASTTIVVVDQALYEMRNWLLT